MTLQMGVTVQRRGYLTTCLLDCSVKLARELAQDGCSSLVEKKQRRAGSSESLTLGFYRKFKRKTYFLFTSPI